MNQSGAGYFSKLGFAIRVRLLKSADEYVLFDVNSRILKLAQVYYVATFLAISENWERLFLFSLCQNFHDSKRLKSIIVCFLIVYI